MKSYEFVRSLVDALDLPRTAQRVVIVADVRETPRVYYKGVLKDGEKAEKVAGLVRAACVADVEVSDDCEVVVTDAQRELMHREGVWPPKES